MAAIHENHPPITKIELTRFVGSLNFYSLFIDKLLFSLKPLNKLLHVNVKVHRSIELETLLQQL